MDNLQLTFFSFIFANAHRRWAKFSAAKYLKMQPLVPLERK